MKYQHIGWHFSEGRLRYGDGRRVRRGIFTVNCKPVLCKNGLHWSKRICDALRYAPGPILSVVCAVEGHKLIVGDDKVVSTARNVLMHFDATDALFEASRLIASGVFYQHFKVGDYPDLDDWLINGNFAAWSAAESAAWSALQYAADSATWSAAQSAARYAARSAAESAAESDAQYAARYAARYAAQSAAWSTAESATDSKHNQILLDCVFKHHPEAKQFFGE